MEGNYTAPKYRVALVREADVCVTDERIESSHQMAGLVEEMLADTDREHFLVLMLDSKNKLIGVNTVSVGCLNSAIVHPREVFKPAILANACSIIIAHNHPSGDPTPSEMDLHLFFRIRDAGELLGIQMLDALVTGNGTHYSACTKGDL